MSQVTKENIRFLAVTCWACEARNYFYPPFKNGLLSCEYCGSNIGNLKI